MAAPLHIAVDLGAGSGRVFLGGASADELLIDEIRRFTYPPQRIDGHLRWDFERIVQEIQSGLREGGVPRRRAEATRPEHRRGQLGRRLWPD
jgi:sugar (pentulose or hexulose) kinase